jgi:hypothetical protein
MTDDIQSLRDDIAYLKAMADSGQSRGAGGGVLLMGAGVIYGAASVVQYLAMEHQVALTMQAASFGWLIATVAFMALLIAVKLRWRADGSSSGAANVAWKGVGIGCFAIFVALALASWRTQSPLLIEFSPSIIFVLYGAAWIAAGTAMRRAWMQWTGWGGFLAAAITAWFIGEPVNYLIYALGLMLLAFVPGVLFVMKAPRAGE